MAEKEGLHQRLKQAIIWLKQNKDMLQLDIAEKMGMTTVGLSRGLARCKEKDDEDFVIKFHQATDEVFSLDWLLHGTGEKFTADIKKPEPAPTAPIYAIDPASEHNATISAYVQLANRLTDDLNRKEQEMADRLADKDSRINDLLAHLREKEDHIATLQGRIADLERQNASLRSLDPTTYPFPIGAAENRTPKNVSP